MIDQADSCSNWAVLDMTGSISYEVSVTCGLWQVFQVINRGSWISKWSGIGFSARFKGPLFLLFSSLKTTPQALQTLTYLIALWYHSLWYHALVLMTHASSLLQALKKVPGVNSSWHGDFIRQYHNIDISIAVQTPNGLMVPVVRDSYSKGLTEIGATVKSLAGKVCYILL